MYKPVDHRVDRVRSFFSSRRNWDSPTPSPTGECAPPFRLVPGGTFACWRGSGGVPIPTRGHTLWYSIFIYVLCAVDHLQGFSLGIWWSNWFIDFGKLIRLMSELRLIYLNAELVGRVNAGEDTKFHRLYNKNHNTVKKIILKVLWHDATLFCLFLYFTVHITIPSHSYSTVHSSAVAIRRGYKNNLFAKVVSPLSCAAFQAHQWEVPAWCLYFPSILGAHMYRTNELQNSFSGPWRMYKLIKKKTKFSIYKEIRMGSVAKSYIYEEGLPNIWGNAQIFI